MVSRLTAYESPSKHALGPEQLPVLPHGQPETWCPRDVPCSQVGTFGRAIFALCLVLLGGVKDSALIFRRSILSSVDFRGFPSTQAAGRVDYCQTRISRASQGKSPYASHLGNDPRRLTDVMKGTFLFRGLSGTLALNRAAPPAARGTSDFRDNDATPQPQEANIVIPKNQGALAEMQGPCRRLDTPGTP